MKKYILVTTIYTVIIIAFDAICGVIVSDVNLARPNEMPGILFMWIFSCWIAAALIVKVINKFIKYSHSEDSKFVSDIVFYIQVRVVALVVIICGSWSLQQFLKPYSEPGENYAFVVQEQIGVIRFIFNNIYLTYIPIAVIIVLFFYRRHKK